MSNHAYNTHLIENHSHYAKLFEMHRDTEQQIHDLASHHPAAVDAIKELKRKKLGYLDGMLQIERTYRVRSPNS